MRCGNCKEEHDTVTGVRNCYAGIGPSKDEETLAAERLDKFNGPGLRKVTDEPMWPASDAQVKYLLGLQDERITPEVWMDYDEPTVRKLERDEVSGLITMLKSFPKKAGAHNGSRYTMPAGRYALRDDGGIWKFYQVDKGKAGTRWEGYTFIKQLIGSPGDYQKNDMAASTRLAILNRIEADPKQASFDFGKQSGTCGVCSSPLTNPESLLLGIGPICRAKVGW